ncbi:GbsR/MarR family transcriptional regulator [Nesterenkonia alba]|uniref:GbsR/MarR family transcriptional regulator n=1 Tax=Nesterenkonia alba TaxID=515814 RepID=UPI0004921C8E|nr:MarR family transcriptional regulator [Nesterenkonia alba]
MSDQDAAPRRDGDPFREQFIQRFAEYWTSEGGPRVEGLIAAYLLVDESDGATAGEISAALGLSRGAVSTYTRKLVDAGFVRRYRKPGDRTDYHVMDADVWGGFLHHHQAYLQSQRQLAAEALQAVDENSPAHERLRYMHAYMEWITEHMRLPERWAQHKAQVVQRRHSSTSK